MMFLEQIRLKKDQKGHMIDQKGLKMYENRQKIEFFDLKNLLFSGIFLTMQILFIKDLPDQMGRKYKRPRGSDGGVFRGRGVQVPSTLSTTCFLMLLMMIMMTGDVDDDVVVVEF